MQTPAEPIPSGRPSGFGLAPVTAILVGVAFTLAVHGYQFGESNHTVYLLQAIRGIDPQLLTRDWFTTQTLQYHALFGWLTGWLARLGVLEAGSLAGYLALCLALHTAWWSIVRSVGGSELAYLLSVSLHYLSAGGVGLGSYHLVQDAAFLPSNIANAGLLGGIALHLRGYSRTSAACFGLAGAFHLNYAVVGIALWAFLHLKSAWSAQVLVASALATVPALLNLAFAGLGRPAHHASLPLAEFVEIYVRFRHPHHYDPRSWHPGIWTAFLWPVVTVFALGWTRRTRFLNSQWSMAEPARRQLLRISAFLACMIGFALLFAGLTYISETLVQMSLYRFSPILHVLCCTWIASAWTQRDRGSANRALVWTTITLAGLVTTIWLAAVRHLTPSPLRVLNDNTSAWMTLLGVTLAPAMFAFSLRLGELQRRASLLLLIITLALVLAIGLRTGVLGVVRVPDSADEDYFALADWAQAHTRVDALFLVPPSETAWRLRARRAIIVNFKGVPQFSDELREWENRLRLTLGDRPLHTLPRGFQNITAAMDDVYAAMTPAQLLGVARGFGADFIVFPKAIEHPDLSTVARSPKGKWTIYRVRRT
jgi:hypothetical protein